MTDLMKKIREVTDQIDRHRTKILTGEYRSYGAALALQQLRRKRSELQAKLPLLTEIRGGLYDK